MDIEKIPSSQSPFAFFYDRLTNSEFPLADTQKGLYDFIKTSCFFENLNWQSMIEDTQNIQKANCAKPIKEGELCFECMDCGLMKENHIYCSECFQKSNHQNHRIKYRNTIWGYCDCGDENMIIKNGFCESHIAEKIDEKALRKRVPKEIRKKLRDLLSLLFSDVLHAIEDHAKSLFLSEDFKAVDQKNIDLLNCLFEVLSNMVDDSFCVLMFLANFINKPLKTRKNKNFDKMFYHDCENYEEYSFKEEKRPCQCSIIGFLFKFNQFLSAKIREQFVSFIFKLSPSLSLKESVVYLMQINVFFIIELKNVRKNDPKKGNLNVSISELTKLNLFYLVNKELAMKFIKSQFFPIIMKKIKYEYELQQENPSHDIISTSLRNVLQYFLLKLVNFDGVTNYLFENGNALEENYLFEKVNALEDLLRILLTIKKRTEFYEDKREISCLQTNYLFFLVIKKLLKIANNEENEEKWIEIITKIFAKTMNLIFSSSLIEKENLFYLRNEQKLNEDIHFLNNVATKTFSLFMSFFLQKFNFNLKKLNDFLIEILEKASIDKEEFATTLSSEAILSIYSKYLVNTIKETKDGKKFLTNNNFTVSGLCFEAFDRFALKILFTLDFGPFSTDSFINFLFNTINIKFSLSNLDNEIYDEEILENELLGLNFVFEVLIILISDSLSLINTLNSIGSPNLTENSNYPFKELEFILANLHLIDPAFNSLPIKKAITKFKKKKIEATVERISTLNKNNHSFELKEEYRNCFDLNLFSEHSNLYQQLYEIIKNLSKSEYSLILGNRALKFYENTIFCKIMKKLIQPEFLSFFFEIIENKHFEEELEKSDISRKILKLLYVLFQMNEKSTNNEEKTIFFSFCEKFHLRKRLDELLIKYEKNSEYGIALQKIREIYDNIMLNSQEKKMSVQISTEIRGKNANEVRKNKILEEFKKKRMNFVDKVEEIPENLTLIKKISTEESVCSFCLQNIMKKDDILCLIAYISNDNISDFLISDEVLKQDSNNLCLVSCNHLVHKECHLMKIKEKKNFFNMNRWFQSDMEFLCNYCKSLSNLTIPIVESFCFSPDVRKFHSNFIYSKEEIKVLNQYLSEDVEKPKLSDFFDLNFQSFFKDFFNEIACAKSYIDENVECSVFMVLLRILLDSFEKIYQKDLFSFISGDFNLVKNLFQLSLFNFLDDEIENPILKGELEHFLEKIMNVHEIINDLANFHRNFLRIILILRFVTNNEEKMLISQMKYQIQCFVSNILILCFILYNPEENEVNLEKLNDFFVEKEIHSKTLTFLAPFYSMIIGVLITCFQTDSKLKSIIVSFVNTEELENSELFKEFIKILEPEPKILQEYIEKWVEILKLLSPEQRTTLKSDISHMSKNPNRLAICEINTYDDLIVQYLSRKCKLCKFYPMKYNQKLYLCLICNVLICNGECGESEDKRKDVGNLTRHAKNTHENKTIYMNMSDGSLYIMSLPFVINEKSLFVDKHGQILGECDKKFADFLINNKRLNKWVNSLVMKKLHQEVLNQISIDSQTLISEPIWKDL